MGGPIAYLKAHPEKSFNVEKSDEFLTRLGHSRANPVCVFIGFFQDTKMEKRAMSACVPQQYFAKSGKYLKHLGVDIDEIEEELHLNQEADLFNVILNLLNLAVAVLNICVWRYQQRATDGDQHVALPRRARV